MSALLANRAVRRRGIAFTILIAVTFLLMAFSSNPALLELQRGVSFAFAPIQRSLDGVASSISGVVGAIGEIDRLRSDNSSLQAENERLKNENARLDEIRRENDQLTALLQLRTGFEYQTVAAQVIARDSSEFRRVVTLDKGTDDEIQVGDVVIAQGGALAGRVVEAGGNYAKVMLITDGSSTVTGQLSTSAATGEVVGQLRGALIMGKIDPTQTVQIGEEVVTAGIELSGGIRSPYPKGLLIGQVIDTRRDANDVVQTAYLDPAVNLDALEYVLVILDYQGGLPPIDQQPIDCNGPAASGGVLPDSEQPCIGPTPSPTLRPTSRPTIRPSLAPPSPKASPSP